MTEGQEVRASHDEVVAFVGKLREFHSSLGEGEQAMLGTILDSPRAQRLAGTARGRLAPVEARRSPGTT